MKTALSRPACIVLLLLASAASFFGAGCSSTPPQIGSVGVTGSYSDRDGDTYGGGVQVGLNYPTPSPKPVDHSK